MPDTPQSQPDSAPVPGGGLNQIDYTLSARIHEWLGRELGPGRYANHGTKSIGTFASAVYFRTVADAQRFVEAFPEWELADGVRSGVYTAPGPRPTD